MLALLAVTPLLQSSVGAGIITISVFALLALCVCFCGAKTSSPGLSFLVASVMLTGIVLFFVYWPKRTPGGSLDEGEDTTYIPRFFTFLALTVGVITSLCCLVNQFCFRTIQGRRVRMD